MANSNWNGGHAKGRAQAKAWLRHNEKDRRADPQVDHTNRDIDKSRTHRNFEVGPTKNLTYVQKCERLDKRLDEFGYPIDRDLGPIRHTTPTSVQGIVIYAPDDLDNDEAEADGRLKKWAEDAVTEAAKQFGEENIIAAYVDVDEVHDYTDAKTGEKRTSKRHIHLYVVPVCEVKAVQREPVYLTPEGEETTDADKAEMVYVTDQNAETDDPERAARDEAGEPMMRPKRARTKAGRPKYKKKKRSEVTKKSTKLSGSEFCLRENIMRFNKAVDDMTREKHGTKWNTGVARDPDKKNETIEEMKAATAAREVADAVAEATTQIEATVTASAQTLADAEDFKADAEQKRDDALKERDDAIVERDKAINARKCYEAETYYTRDKNGTRVKHLGLKGLKQRNTELRAENERLRKENGDLDARAKQLDAREALVEGRETDIAKREAAVTERERKAKEQEQHNARVNAENARLNEQRKRAYETAKKNYEDATQNMNDYVAQLKAEWQRFSSNIVEFVSNAMRRVGHWFGYQSDHWGLNTDEHWQLKNTSDELYNAANIIIDRPKDPNLIAACTPDAPLPWESVAKPAPVNTASIDAMIAKAMEAGLEDDDDTEAQRPGSTGKRMGRQTAQRVQSQRVSFAQRHGIDIDDVDTTPSTDDYEFGF